MAVTKKTTKTGKGRAKATAKKSPAKATADRSGPADRKPDARARLKALKARRENLQPGPRAAKPAKEAAEEGGGPGLAAILGGAAPSKLHGKILTQIYGILTQSSGSDTKMVPGTQFSEDGVRDLLKKLNRRARNENQKGAKIAGMILKFLSPKDGDEDVVAGASLEKLRVLSAAATRVVKGK